MITNIEIEVVYISNSHQYQKTFEVEAGTSVIDAVHLSGVCDEFPDLKLGKLDKLGIFGKAVDPQDCVKAFDRVEIYRPLLVDPMQARRLRAQKRAADTGER
jgi:putative ubiquitin-RnfH superfamily antitoxin RatB of RatAB toxin-antitoxin module